MRRITIPAMLALLPLVACDKTEGPGGLENVSVVAGVAFIDRDVNGTVSSGDSPVAGVVVALELDGTSTIVAQTTSRDDGTFRITNVPPGRYEIVASRGTAGDTLDVLHIANPRFTLAAGDTIQRLVRMGYPRTTAAAVASLPTGKRVTVEGIALTGWATFGDATLHVQDATGAVRAIRVGNTPVNAGDSVQVLGVVGQQDGGVVLADASAGVVLSAAGLPAAPAATTAQAAAASGPARPYDQVALSGALVLDTASATGDFVLTVDDGSGPVDVVLDGNVNFGPGPYVPGATFNGEGVLVRSGTPGTWRVKPRSSADADFEFVTISVAAARALPPGERVVVEGVALNSWAAFGDSTVHILDPSGAMRGFRVRGSVLAGDSILLIGTTEVRNGQPVLNRVTAGLHLRAVGVPVPDSISTASAASAMGGSLDANQVKVAGTITGSQILQNGDGLFNLDDGSGRVEVIFDKDVPIAPGAYVPGAILEVTGVLVPAATGGKWQLKPRTASDVAADYPSVSIDAARNLPVGRTVYIEGVALNSRLTFSDLSVHVADPTGAIRVLNLPQYPLFAGDSVRILGTVALNNGFPVLQGVNVSVLLTGVGTPPPVVLSTSAAAGASDGARDAALVQVSGTINSVSGGGAGNDILLTVDDGSGPLTVRLDRQVGFQVTNYTAGSSVQVVGVLVPAGGKWELKPRLPSDITGG